MKLILLYLLSGFFFVSFGQARRFEAQMNEIFNLMDKPVEISERIASSEQFNFLVKESTVMDEICLSVILREHKKGKSNLQKSLTLSKFAEAATEAWKGSHYAEKDKWINLNKYFKRAKVNLPTNFNLIESVSFRIDLMSTTKKLWYYDRKGDKGDLNLYEGRKPRNKEEEELNEKIPVPVCTELEIEKQLLDELSRRGIVRKLNKGVYSFVGVSIKVDENTLFRSKLPTARVVVFLGARRLQNLKI